MEHYLKLSRRDQLFVDKVVESGSPPEAIRQTRPNVAHPRRTAYKVLRKPGVREAIEERTQEAIAEAGVTHLRTIQELASVAYFKKPRGPDGKLLPIEDWPDSAVAAVSGCELEPVYEGTGEARKLVGTTASKYRTWSKVEALKLLMQYQRLIVERHEHSGPGGKPLQPPTFAISFENGGPGVAPDEGVEVSNDAKPIDCKLS